MASRRVFHHLPYVLLIGHVILLYFIHTKISTKQGSDAERDTSSNLNRDNVRDHIMRFSRVSTRYPDVQLGASVTEKSGRIYTVNSELGNEASEQEKTRFKSGQDSHRPESDDVCYASAAARYAFLDAEDYFKRVCERCAEERRFLQFKLDNTENVCDCLPPTLQGNLHIDMNKLLAATWDEVEMTQDHLQNGGYWVPKYCIPRRKVAIIVPFRDRENQLRVFLQHIHPILQAQAMEYQIFVVEQNYPYKFNKGSLMNAGYMEMMYKLDFRPDCVIFHDVDLLSETDLNIYMCLDVTVHLGAFVDKFDYRLLYHEMFGGAIAITPGEFEVVNGYSNVFEGWGGEDDDFFLRQRLSNKVPWYYRPPVNISRYTMIPHGRDLGNPASGVKFDRSKFTLKSTTNGLQNLEYSQVSTNKYLSHTRILVDLARNSNLTVGYDVMPVTLCVDRSYRREIVSMVKCEYLCTEDDKCEAFQYVQSYTRDSVCELLKQPCIAAFADGNTNIYTKRES